MKIVERDRIIADAKAEYARVIDQAAQTYHMTVFRDRLHHGHIRKVPILLSVNPKFSHSRWRGRRVHEMPEAEGARWEIEWEAERTRWHAERLGRVRSEAKAEYDRAIAHADTEYKRTITAESVKLSSFQWPEYDRAIETASADAERAKVGPNAGHKNISAIVRDAAGSKFLSGWRDGSLVGDVTGLATASPATGRGWRGLAARPVVDALRAYGDVWLMSNDCTNADHTESIVPSSEAIGATTVATS